MGMSGPDRKRLWGRSGNRCAMPGCNKPLTAGIADYVTDSSRNEAVTLGEEAHIIAESDDGPRAKAEMPRSERDAYPNRILLCEACHKVVDAYNGKYFPTEVLLQIKRDHEERVQHGMESSDQEKQRMAESMMQFVEEWGTRVRTADWNTWTSHLLNPSPDISAEEFEEFSDTASWLGSRRFPTAHFPCSRQAIEIFSTVWSDLIRFLDRNLATARVHGMLTVRKRHKEELWEPEEYNRLSCEYEANIAVLHELIYHASAAANLLIDSIGIEIDPIYTFNHGAVTITRMGDNLRFTHYRPEYTEECKKRNDVYPGLKYLTQWAQQDLRKEYEGWGLSFS